MATTLASNVIELDRSTHTTEQGEGLLTGAALGTVERRYGLMACDEIVRIQQLLEQTGDLAVADRVAFVFARRSGRQVAVVEQGGWFWVALLDRHLSTEQANGMRVVHGSPRLLSMVDDRGIVPLVGPLAG